MQINNITLENFRPFYGITSVKLTTTHKENIILIGGKNGYGKTNFLLSIVWCLYGKLIGNVDESFKAEIANNYPKFLKEVLNDDAKIAGDTQFSVELSFGGVDDDEHKQSTIKIKRSYDINSQDEPLLEIVSDEGYLSEIKTEEEKQNFINDYLIPIEIARFVFFDAEKISQIADLSTAKQAKLMDKTLGNMLGLNAYQNLLEEIGYYIKSLKKESSTQETQEQITNFENAIKQSKQSIETKNIDLQNKTKEIKEITNKIEKFEIEINRKGGDNTDIKSLHQQRDALSKQRDNVKSKFSDIADIIPLLILSGLMQEAKEHIEIEQDNQKNELSKTGFSEKVDLFVNKLFNQGALPSPDIDFKQKAFYATKSESLAKCFIDDSEKYELPFEHDLDGSKIKGLQDYHTQLQNQSNTDFISVITDYSKKKVEYEKLDRKIRKIEATSANDLTKSLIDDRDNCQKEKDSLNRRIGSIESDISKFEAENAQKEKRLTNLYAKSKVNTKNQEKINLSEQYIEVLKDFIQLEKEEKKESIKKKLLEELQKLWHKQLVQDVRLTILPSDNGLEVEMLDGNNNPIDSEKLSKGEQQLYVSALLKSILYNSIHDLPVFIDTPLARLDSTHRDRILKHYYPNLSNQVVVFSTDTEITASEYAEIKQHITKSYLITNINKKSSISEGYFN